MSNTNQNWTEKKHDAIGPADVAYVPTFAQLQDAQNIPDWLRGDQTLRDRRGQFVKPNSILYAEAESYAYHKWAEQAWLAYYPDRGSIFGKADLGTFRSKRKAKDFIRERDRRLTCIECGGPLPEPPPGRKVRANRLTCSVKCRKALSRNPRVPVSSIADEASDECGHGDTPWGRTCPLCGVSLPKPPPPLASWHSQRKLQFARARVRLVYGSGRSVTPLQQRIREGMEKQLSPLTEALIEATVKVWDVPMPAGYPDERDWRLGQKKYLLALARDERSASSPSAARFTRRANAYIRHMRKIK
jgi:hypothetical protein